MSEFEPDANSSQSYVNEEQDQYTLQTDRGFAFLSRSFNTSSTWQMGYEVILVAIYLILEANHTRMKFPCRFQGKEIWIERGEVLRSQSRMIREIQHLTKKQFRTAWNKLEKFGFFENITPKCVKGAHSYTHVRLCKYDGYQNAENYKGHVKGTLGAHKGQLYNNGISNNELLPTSSITPKYSVSINYASARKKRACRIPFECLTQELIDIAVKYGLNGKTEIVFEKFRNYWLAQPGQRGTKLDWVATWRNWCINEKERSYTSSASKPGAGRVMADQSEERIQMLRRIFDDDK